MKRKIIFALIISFTLIAILGLRAALSAKSALNSTNKAVDAIKNQDLDAAKNHVTDAKKKFQTANSSLNVLTPLRIVPLFGWYISDAQRATSAAVHGMEAAQIMVDAIAPYADVLGFKGDSQFLGGTAQERLALAVETLAKVNPQLNEVVAKLENARKDIDKIASWRYPNIFPGNPGDKIDTAKQTLKQVDTFLVEAKPLIEVLPDIMGQKEEKKYLILLQNDKELRPTGGFITAYAIFRVNKGSIESEGSEDIYKLDESLTKTFPAPAPIIAYLSNVSTLNIRDSNLSPDYLASMKQFEEIYQSSTKKKEVDGIIALDTEFALKMLEVLGPLEASGTKFTTEIVEECECPQIIHELELYADQPVAFEKGDRKGIIGILMSQMMAKTFEAPRSSWPKIMGVALDSLQQKHILLYFKDKKSQEAAEKVNFAGRIYNWDGDFLHINETNFGGAKSNMYLEEKVKQTIKKTDDGKINKKITLEYEYPRRMDNCSLERKGGLCLAGIYRDWIRIYVPKGSTLVKGSGTEIAFTTTEDLDKTVFEAFFTVRPEGTAKVEIEYTVPLKLSGEYKLLIQKQGGTPAHEYEIDAFGKKIKAFPLDEDKQLKIKI